jgi:hypothetical protein
MTGKEFSDYIRYRTRTNSTTFPDADIVLLGDVWLEKLAKAVMGADEDTLLLPQTTDLNINIREYPFPKDILSRMKRVEAKFDGTNWIWLSEFDLVDYKKPTDEATILANFSNEEGHAFYDLSRKSIWIYSGTIIAVVNGLKLWCNTYPAKLTAAKLANTTDDLSLDPSTTEHGFPRELHKLWAEGVIIDYKQSREKPIPLTERELKYDGDLEEAVVALRHGNLDREVIADLPASADRGDNGQDF